MKIKCYDGKTRTFTIAYESLITGLFYGGRCCHCGFDFGVHDTNILREKFKFHIECDPKKEFTLP